MNKKITRATLKSFIRKNTDNLYCRELSSFNGMVDMVESSECEFSKVSNFDLSDKNNFGVSGLWLVGSSRDSFSEYSDGQFTGIKIYNCCGSSIVATPVNRNM